MEDHQRPEIHGRAFLEPGQGTGGAAVLCDAPRSGWPPTAGLHQEIDPKTNKEKVEVKGEIYRNAWSKLQQEVLNRYHPDEKQAAEIKKLSEKYDKSLTSYLAENAEEIAAHFESLDRFVKEQAEGNNGAALPKEAGLGSPGRAAGRSEQVAQRARRNGWPIIAWASGTC